MKIKRPTKDDRIIFRLSKDKHPQHTLPKDGRKAELLNQMIPRVVKKGVAGKVQILRAVWSITRVEFSPLAIVAACEVPTEGDQLEVSS